MEDILLYTFFTAVIVQAVLFLFIFPSILFHSDSNSKEIKGVSIIIAAHNEKDNLQRLVPELLKQQYPDFEIIIALDRCTDGSKEYLQTISESRLSFLNLTNIPDGFNSKKFALTQAIQKSVHENLLMTDADCIPASEKWIEKMLGSFTREKEIVLGYSPYLKEKGFLNLFIRFETLVTAIQYLSFALIKMPYMGVGRNLAYKKSFFQDKGFKGIEELTGGDDDLLIGKVSTGKNTTICIHPEGRVYSIPKKTFKEYFHQKKRHLAIGTRYSILNMVKSALLPISQFLLYFSLIALISLKPAFSGIWGIFILRSLVIIVIFALIARKLGDTFRWFWFPVLDLSYLISFIVIGIPAAFTRNKIKWK